MTCSQGETALEAATMTAYTCRGLLRHDGKSYKEGEVVEMAEEFAVQLLKDGVIESSPGKKSARRSTTAKTSAST